MEKCVYCGKALPEKPFKAKVHTRSFAVCSAACRARTETYVARDKRFKLVMYLLIFAGGLGFIISAMFGKGAHAMLGAYTGQILAGLAFLLLPYPISSFETFHAMSIRSVTRLTRIIGAALVIWGFVLLVIT